VAVARVGENKAREAGKESRAPQHVSEPHRRAHDAKGLHRGKQREIKRTKRGTQIKRAVLQHRENRYAAQASAYTENTFGAEQLNAARTSGSTESEARLRSPRPENSETLLANGVATETASVETARQRMLRQRSLPPVVPSTNNEHSAPYCSNRGDEVLDRAVKELLQDLTRFQKRLNPDDPNFRARRRFVHGLHEVTRAVEAGRLRAVLIAPDVESTGEVPHGPQEAIAKVVCAAERYNTPVVFALSRAALARALGLNRAKRVSVIGIYSADGAHEKLQNVLLLTKETKQTCHTFGEAQSVAKMSKQHAEP